MTSVVVVIGLAGFFTLPERELARNQENYKAQLNSYAGTISLGIDLALGSGDFASLDKVYALAESDEKIEFIAIYSDGELFNAKQKDTTLTFESLVADEMILKDSVDFTNDIMGGTVVLGMNQHSLIADYESTRNLILWGAFGTILISFLLSFLLAYLVEKPIKQVQIAAESFAVGNLDVNLTTDYNDSTGKMLKAMDSMRGKLQSMVKEMDLQYEEHSKGSIEHTMNSEKFNGVFKTMIDKSNTVVNYHIDSILTILDVTKCYSNGDFDKICKEFPGQQVMATNIMNQLRENLLSIMEELDKLTSASKSGDLTKRGDSEKFQGLFKDIIIGFNQTLDSIIDPLNEADEVINEYSKGDFTVRMNGQYTGYYENLKNNVNVLGESLEQIIINVRQAVKTVVETSFMIKDSSGQLSLTSNNQNDEAQSVAAAVEEMASTIDANAQNSLHTAKSAEDNGNLAQQGGQVVQLTVQKMKDIADVVRASANNVTKLGESSNEIGEIISVIDEIADQTNLLALNAAIEAARAGEQGRGFAVVADEVRKLAERTSEATQQISQMISAIQEETVKAVKDMSSGTEEVDNGIKLADEAGEALNQILGSSDEVLKMINQIAAANEEQSATSSEIASSVSKISEMTEDSTLKVSEVANAAEQMADLSEELDKMLTKYNVRGSNSAVTNAISNSSSKLLN